MFNTENKRSRYFRGKYLSIVLILFVVIILFLVSNKCSFDKNLEQENKDLQKIVVALKKQNIEFIGKDNLTKEYLDSVRFYKDKDREALTNLFVKEATNRLTEHSQQIAKEASNINSTLILWASILTLISIIFTFLGLSEVKSKTKYLSQIEEEFTDKKKELDYKVEKIEESKSKIERIKIKIETTGEQIEEVLEKKIREINEIISQVKDTENQLHKTQTSITKEITNNRKIIEDNSKSTTYKLKLQEVLLIQEFEDKISMLLPLISEIESDDFNFETEKNDILEEVYYFSGCIYKGDKSNVNYEKSIEYYKKGLNMNIDNHIIHNNLGDTYKSLGDIYQNKVNESQIVKYEDVKYSVDNYLNSIREYTFSLNINKYSTNNKAFTNLNSVYIDLMIMYRNNRLIDFFDTANNINLINKIEEYNNIIKSSGTTNPKLFSLAVEIQDSIKKLIKN